MPHPTTLEEAMRRYRAAATPVSRETAGKPWYSIRAAGADTAEVLIYGAIGESWWGESVTAKQFVEDLQKIQDKNLVVRINSYGGSVSDGVAIHNAIKRHPKQKIAEIDGVAVSIASLIPMACDVVRGPENVLLMVHAPWGVVAGNSAVMREYAEVLEKHAQAMATSYAAKTGKSADDMYELLSDGKDHWYTASEAKEFGFVDEVTAAQQSEESARYHAAVLARFKVPPAAAGKFAAIAASLTPNKEKVMPKTETPAAENTPETTNVVAIENAAQAKATAAIKARNVAIVAMFAPHLGADGVSALQAECLADPALTEAEASKRLLAKLGEGYEPAAMAATGRIVPGPDETDKFRGAVSDALLVRAGIRSLVHSETKIATPIDLNGNPYRNGSLLDAAKSCLRRAGKNPDGMDKNELVAAAFQTTSDFPVLLENTMHKVALQAYLLKADTWSRFCKIGSVSDFRAHNRYRSGSTGNLQPVNENGEFMSLTMPDGEKGTVTADTKGGIIRISRKAIVNDDLSALTDMALAAGRSAKRTIESDVYALLALNSGLGPTLVDTLTLFHANHNNITNGAAISVDNISLDAQAMAVQTGVGGNDYLDLSPAILVSSVAIGEKAKEVNAQEFNDEATKNQRRPNTTRGLFRDVVGSPRITGTRRYLFADPNEAPVLEVSFLDGKQEPYLESKDGWDTDGAELKVRIDFAVGAIDYRGAVTNAGA